jgi:hypothetical protein
MNRRDSLKQTGLAAAVGIAGLLLVLHTAYSAERKPGTDLISSAPFQSEAEAAEKGEMIGIGSAKLEGPETAEVFTYQTWTVVYTAGKAGIKPGGGIRIGLRHLFHCWGVIQNEEPKSEGYLTVKPPDNVPVSVLVECGVWDQKFFTQYFPWQNIVEVVVSPPGLQPGETIRVTVRQDSRYNHSMNHILFSRCMSMPSVMMNTCR